MRKIAYERWTEKDIGLLTNPVLEFYRNPCTKCNDGSCFGNCIERKKYLEQMHEYIENGIFEYAEIASQIWNRCSDLWREAREIGKLREKLPKEVADRLPNPEKFIPYAEHMIVPDDAEPIVKNKGLDTMNSF